MSATRSCVSIRPALTMPERPTDDTRRRAERITMPRDARSTSIPNRMASRRNVTFRYIARLGGGMPGVGSRCGPVLDRTHSGSGTVEQDCSVDGPELVSRTQDGRRLLRRLRVCRRLVEVPPPEAASPGTASAGPGKPGHAAGQG